MLSEPKHHAAERFQLTFLRGSVPGCRVSPTLSEIVAPETGGSFTAALTEFGAVAAGLEAAVNAS
jgi:hypothetical protein